MVINIVYDVESYNHNILLVDIQRTCNWRSSIIAFSWFLNSTSICFLHAAFYAFESKISVISLKKNCSKKKKTNQKTIKKKQTKNRGWKSLYIPLCKWWLNHGEFPNRWCCCCCSGGGATRKGALQHWH